MPVNRIAILTWWLVAAAAAPSVQPAIITLLPVDGSLVSARTGTLSGRFEGAVLLRVDAAEHTLGGDGGFSYAFVPPGTVRQPDVSKFLLRNLSRPEQLSRQPEIGASRMILPHVAAWIHGPLRRSKCCIVLRPGPLFRFDWERGARRARSVAGLMISTRSPLKS